MKTYTFHSALPPEQVRARLMVYQGKVNRLDENRTMVQFLKDGSFYLQINGKRDGGLWLDSSGTFHGRVEAENEGSRITGRFCVRKSTAMSLLAVMLFPALYGLVFFRPLTWNDLKFYLYVLAIAAGAYAVMWLYADYKDKPAIRFIEEHLLHP